MREAKEEIKTRVSPANGAQVLAQVTTQILIPKSDYNRATERACTCKYCFHYIFVNL